MLKIQHVHEPLDGASRVRIMYRLFVMSQADLELAHVARFNFL